MGRVNYGSKLLDKKGLLDGVRLGPQFHFGWEMLPLPMEDLSNLQWTDEADGPRFLRGWLSIDETPKDTFLKLDNFTKGFVLVNGFNIGRFYTPAGPQKTLYIPAPLLKQGENEIIVFESDSFHSPTVEFVDTPELGKKHRPGRMSGAVSDCQKARHCEEGAARRGNPVTFLPRFRGLLLLSTGFPRSSAHWLGMTCSFSTHSHRPGLLSGAAFVMGDFRKVRLTSRSYWGWRSCP